MSAAGHAPRFWCPPWAAAAVPDGAAEAVVAVVGAAVGAAATVEIAGAGGYGRMGEPRYVLAPDPDPTGQVLYRSGESSLVKPK